MNQSLKKVRTLFLPRSSRGFTFTLLRDSYRTWIGLVPYFIFLICSLISNSYDGADLILCIFYFPYFILNHAGFPAINFNNAITNSNNFLSKLLPDCFFQ